MKQLVFLATTALCCPRIGRPSFASRYGGAALYPRLRLRWSLRSIPGAAFYIGFNAGGRFQP